MATAIILKMLRVMPPAGQAGGNEGRIRPDCYIFCYGREDRNTVTLCRGRDLNPHGTYVPRDFKFAQAICIRLYTTVLSCIRELFTLSNLRGPVPVCICLAPIVPKSFPGISPVAWDYRADPFGRGR